MISRKELSQRFKRSAKTAEVVATAPSLVKASALIGIAAFFFVDERWGLALATTPATYGAASMIFDALAWTTRPLSPDDEPQP